MIKSQQKNFTESIPYDKVSPEKIRQHGYQFKNIHKIENKLTHFQIYPETELACKYNTSLYKTQYAESRVKYEQGFVLNTGKLITFQNLTHHLSNRDGMSYTPVTLLNTYEELVANLNHKTKAVHVYKNYHS